MDRRGPISQYLLPYEAPKRGDIIAFEYPADTSQLFVKRVIGVPGDHVELVNQQVYINDKKTIRTLRSTHQRIHRSLSRQLPERYLHAGCGSR